MSLEELSSMKKSHLMLYMSMKGQSSASVSTTVERTMGTSSVEKRVRMPRI
jgi:hypothetical protein